MRQSTLAPSAVQQPRRHVCFHGNRDVGTYRVQQATYTTKQQYSTIQCHSYSRFSQSGDARERRRQALLDNVDDDDVADPRSATEQPQMTPAAPSNGQKPWTSAWPPSTQPPLTQPYSTPQPAAPPQQQPSAASPPPSPPTSPSSSSSSSSSSKSSSSSSTPPPSSSTAGWGADWAPSDDGWGPSTVGDQTGADSGGWDGWAERDAASDATQQPSTSGRTRGSAREFARSVFGAFMGGRGRAAAAEGPKADVVPLTEEEEELVLPAIPYQEQAQYFAGDVLTLAQRMGAAIVVMVITAAKAPLIAAGAFTAPILWPWGQAALKNLQVRGKFDYIGLWRTKVLEVNLVQQQGRPAPPTSIPPPPSTTRGAPPGVSTLLVVGDDSGARAELMVEYSYRHDVVQVGEAAELLVLSTDPDFRRFKALKEAYLPESGIWMSTYPYIAKDRFLEISLDIERERQAQQQRQAQ